MSIYVLKCNKCDCEFEVYIGISSLFPMVYQQTIDDIEEGKYGEKIKVVFDSIHNAAVDAGSYLYKCDGCGYWEEAPGLSIYAPDDPKNKVDSYVADPAHDENYHIYRRYIHVCPKCRKRMRRISELEELNQLKCINCGGICKIKTILMD